MAEITKFSAAEVFHHIKHDLRELPPKKQYGNENINRSLTRENYSLLEDRCRTANEANIYRKEIEKEVFKYNRKNLIHAIEICVQCPADCPPEQHTDFFEETYNYICSTLPMGNKCVFIAQVHKDERKYSPDGNLISKDHLHVMYVPAVKDTKHDGYEYRLCADQLTRKAKLKEFHPGLQKHLDDVGIQATVYRKKEGDGKSIGLTVTQLKAITKNTGIVLDHDLTFDEIKAVVNAKVLTADQVKDFNEKIREKDAEISALKAENAAIKKSLEHAQQEIKELSNKVEHLIDSHASQKEATKETDWWGTSGWSNTSGWGKQQTTNHTYDIEEEKTW